MHMAFQHAKSHKLLKLRKQAAKGKPVGSFGNRFGLGEHIGDTNTEAPG